MSAPRPKDAMRAFLSIALLACFMLALFWLLGEAVPDANRDLVTYMLGQLSGFAAGAVIYYFGTTKGSSDKNEIIREQAEGPTHVNEAGEPLPVRHARAMPAPAFGGEQGAP